MSKRKPLTLAQKAFAFIVLMSIMSLFNDMVFEGANSVQGKFESFLGAPTIVIAAVGGVATLLGSGLRLFFGSLSDKTKKYWLFTILGYTIDMASVPLLAAVPNGKWQLAVFFILMEKFGKAIKKPSKSALVSFAAKERGAGKSFALGEALDQIGACIGPLILTAVYSLRLQDSEYSQYVWGFASLSIPAILCLALLWTSRFLFPKPESFEHDSKEKIGSFLSSKTYVLFVIGAFVFAMGFMDSFGLINKHLGDLTLLPDNLFPLLYSYAMLIDALSALLFGYLYDHIGFRSVGLAALFTAPYAFCFFMNSNLLIVFLGLTFWGIGMGAMESVLLSGVTSLSPKADRAKAFGFYELAYGVSAFAFSFLHAYLYENHPMVLCVFTSVTIGVSSVLFFLCEPLHQKEEKSHSI